MERWFALITQRAIRRGSFGSVKDLVEKIGSFVHHYNRSHRPFVWTATTDDSQAVLLTIFPLLEELPERFHSVILSQRRNSSAAVGGEPALASRSEIVISRWENAW